MNIWMLISIALKALLRNKLRSALTALGMIIGVGAVVAMSAIGAGAKAQVEKTFEAMGSNMLIVRSGSSSKGGMRGGAGSQPTITWEDVAAIQELDEVVASAPLLQTSVQVSAFGQNWSTSLQGTTPDFATVRNWPCTAGRWFDDNDNATKAKVAVIGKSVVTNLFGEDATEEDILGQTLRAGQIPFEIIGIAKSRGQSGPGFDQDDVVLIPVNTYRAKISGGLAQYMQGTLYVSASSRETTAAAESAISELLRTRHRIGHNDEDDFMVRNMSDMMAAQEESANTITALLAGIALVSMVVGGIGIMNIMLVSVTERTREIGLRMAIGAKPRHILLQFLIESIVLAMVGGFLGVATGIGVATYMGSSQGWAISISPDTILYAVGSSALVGTLFGLWPAYRASHLDPIQALRFE